MASELTERDLYGGKYHLVHNPNARGSQPRYVVNGKDKPTGVTTILGRTLSKDLMQWAVDACVDYIRTRLPIVTEEDLKIGASEYVRLRDAGGNWGSKAHAYIERFLKGETISVTGEDKEVSNAVNAFIEWFTAQKPEIRSVEDLVYSETYGYAGTYDALLRFEDKNYLCDMKTTNPSKKAPQGVYAEMFLQLGAYWLAREEQRKYEDKNGGSELITIDDLAVLSAKKNGVFDIIRASDLGLTPQVCGELFEKIIVIDRFMRDITNELGGK